LSPSPITPDPHDTLSSLNGAAEAIWLACSPRWPQLTVDVLPEATSTNTLLMARGRAGDTAPCVMVAARQTAGRGRLGRSWLADEGRSLTFSLGLPLNLDAVPGGGSALSLVVGATLATTLKRWLQPAQAGLGLKWPNDLLWQGRKLAGVLIEATPAPGLNAGERWVVIGVGLNLQAPLGDTEGRFAALTHLTQPAEQAEPAHRPTVGDALSQLAPALIEASAAFAQQGFAPWQAAYAQHDVLAGQPVELWSAQQERLGEGLAQGIDGDGALLVHTPSGVVRWTSGEVSVRSSAWPQWAPAALARATAPGPST
jgi:BirA family biotin operon repressor/biotin-[acetyl-CoA-carboxylase] ligase